MYLLHSPRPPSSFAVENMSSSASFTNENGRYVTVGAEYFRKGEDTSKCKFFTPRDLKRAPPDEIDGMFVLYTSGKRTMHKTHLHLHDLASLLEIGNKYSDSKCTKSGRRKTTNEVKHMCLEKVDEGVKITLVFDDRTDENTITNMEFKHLFDCIRKCLKQVLLITNDE